MLFTTVNVLSAKFKFARETYDEQRCSVNTGVVNSAQVLVKRAICQESQLIILSLAQFFNNNKTNSEKNEKSEKRKETSKGERFSMNEVIVKPCDSDS